MNTQDLMKIAEEHLASYLRLATSHEGKSLEDDEEALMWHDKADAIADLMDDWKRRQPTVDAVPVRHGKWLLEWENEDTRMLRCSECRMVFNVGKGRDGNFCPNCGARMDKE